MTPAQILQSVLLCFILVLVLHLEIRLHGIEGSLGDPKARHGRLTISSELNDIRDTVGDIQSQVDDVTSSGVDCN